ncbi:ABC transporter substrate-binding protein [Acrocarpospora pleiomorpha]|uniref:ABC transporter substrate-binding protein n=1 Tax=Acrocarpospora pleiomorpha TaxID=90975 RepID=A0A5M3XEU1_9ACTN|nr:ABC transporter substrate-binding protein [Acrocarpospora pleiomorpha]GES19146.1 ABC transporter substrate-binding protein [Acrocarpospora pleiomorpha]
MRTTTLGAIIAGAGLVIPIVAACAASDPAGTQSPAGGTPLRVSFATAPSSIDPAKSCTGEDRQLLNSLYVRLVDFGAKPSEAGTTKIDYSKILPYLAKSWTASDDGKTYTFQLNTGWKFPSGAAMDASAVKFSLDRALTMNQCGATILNDLYSDPNLITEIAAPDANTVVITLDKPDPQILSALADTSGGIVDPGVVNANGGVVKDTANTWMDSHSAGGGPFTLESYSPGTSAVLKANPAFGGPPPLSKEINVTWTTSPATELVNVQNGATDIAFGLGGSAFNSLRSSSSVQVVSYDDTQSMLMTMPNNKAPWTNEKVREAAVLAIPTQDIIKNVMYGFGKPYYGPIPPSMPGYSDQYGQPVAQDIAKAKALIAESGVKTPIEVTLDIQSGDQNQKTISTIVQSALQQIGINLTLRTLTSSAWSDAVYNGKSQAALRLDGPAYANAGYYLQYDEDCDSAYNTGYICIPANTDLLKQARATSDTAKQNQLYAEITKNYVARFPRVTLYQSLTPVALNKTVKSFHYSESLDMRRWAKS